ncbi:pentatricopeptide repeat-containing protein At4g02750-like [Selaginella moellendorffii]|uniref:pentatricopeptide repeat-containing protein At4g02750-like n=1 Tax=Selaginella moellendorffii TaxID=88036 RepID=UPI000D1D0FC9|nr:pentatricopeptide repeat-containing protein At4g02750-like [Selaginella moellendorffii]|eukprot:XP_024534866.1 pentatricopeptide repeat-containing protein At4g02750-like [Selaginella moellendorffii]
MVLIDVQSGKFSLADVSFANSLVQFYGKRGELDAAFAVFTDIRKKSTLSWNLIMSAYAHRGHMQKAEVMFEAMPYPNIASWTTILAGYGRIGHVDHAFSIFQKMPQKNVVTWNAMISAFAMNGHLQDALECFEKMLLEGTGPSVSSFISLGSESLHHHFITMIQTVANDCGLISSPQIATSLITWLTKTGSFNQAQEVYNKVPLHKRDTILRTAMISANAQAGHLCQAEEIFQNIAVKDSAAWNVMISAYSTNSELPKSVAAFNSAPQKNVVAWSAMISAYARHGLHSDAVRTFSTMDLEGVRPNKITFLNVLDACGSASLLPMAKLICSEAASLGLDEDVSVGSAIVSAFGKCSTLEATLEAFQSIRHTNSVVPWTAVITAAARAADWDACLGLFRDMISEGVMPNQVTFRSVLCASSRRGELATALDHCSSMAADFDVEMAEEHYVCVVDMLARARIPGDCRDLMQHMPFQPGVVAWTNLLLSSGHHHQLDAAKKVAQLDSKLAIPYVLWSNARARES